ncbi:MAG: carboxypeptidase regulatory-like domain-containing protein [Verrucomicrobiaceae bacterium]|nr:MAG: carboxypeptidase regulatory-like domain-containing protein [Verrucomicrobiaceae bacterium]
MRAGWWPSTAAASSPTPRRRMRCETTKCGAMSPAHCAEQGEAGTVSRDALLAQNAELRIAAFGVIRGTITDPQGRPVPEAEVFILPKVLRPADLPAVSSKEDPAPKLPIKTDSSGAFSLPWKHTEDVILTVFSSSHPPAQHTASVSAAIQPLKMSLPEGRKITGRVVDADENPLSDAAVHLFTLGQNGVPVRRKIAVTDADGQFTWEQGPRHNVSLIFLKDGYSSVIKDFGFHGSVQAMIRMSKAVPMEPEK